MRRVVLPGITTTTVPADVGPVATVDVGVAVEIVISVDVDVTTTPTTAPAPSTTPGGAHRQTDSERNRAGGNHTAGWIRRVVD